MNSVSLMPRYKNYLKVRCLNLDTHSCVLASFSEEISSTGFAVNCICLLCISSILYGFPPKIYTTDEKCPQCL